MPGPRILVVEDEINARDALVSLLADEGYEVAAAGDGIEGRAKLGTFQPDAVLTDLRLPGLNGIELLRTAREQGSGVPFIVMTGHASSRDLEEARQLGADSILTKPLTIEKLLEDIQHALGRRCPTS